MRYIVTLTEEQNRIALAGAEARRRYDARPGFKREEDTAKGKRSDADMESDGKIGAKGELAYAVWQRHPWRWDFPPLVPRGQTKAPDFSGDRDIKTIYFGGHHLLLQRRDPADRIYILARTNLETLDVQFLGWAIGEEGKLEANWKEGREHRPCFWTHMDDLHGMETCPGIKIAADPEPQLPTYLKLAPGAKCGKFTCGGCYSIGDGRMIHPPRSGFDQQVLARLDHEAI